MLSSVSMVSIGKNVTLGMPQSSRQSSDEEFDSSIFSDAEVVEYLDEMQFLTPRRSQNNLSKTTVKDVSAVKIPITSCNLELKVNPEVPQAESAQNLEEPSLFDMTDLFEFSDDEYNSPGRCEPKPVRAPNQSEVVDLMYLSDHEFGSSVFGDDETLNCIDRSQITFQNQQQSPFLRLPPEIRNNIYDYIFVSPNYMDPYYNAPWQKRNANEWRKASFTTCCRQVQVESQYVFWSKNSFYFYFIGILERFMEDLPIAERELLRTIKYHYTRRGNPFRALRYLRSCTNLQNLEIAVKISVSDSYDPRDHWLYPFLNAKQFFLTPYSTVEFGPVQCFGTAVGGTPNQSEIDDAIENLGNALRKVKLEEQGRYNHHKYPDIFTDVPKTHRPAAKKAPAVPACRCKPPPISFGRWESNRISRA